MVLDLFTKLYSLVSQLSSNTKNLIIVVMFFVISIMAYEDLGNRIVDDTIKTTLELKTKAENYSKEMTPAINGHVYRILMSDPDACNVILLSYHNSQTSSQGFSYLYITGLTEEGKWDITKPYISNWHELSVINYGNELDRIHKLKYLRVDSVENMKEEYPKLYFKLKECDASSAAFYPIQSRTNTAGMLVMLYKNTKKYELGYYMKTIEPCMTELYDILDYMKKQENMK